MFLKTYVLVGLLALLTWPGLAQQITVGSAVYMDTTSSRNSACAEAAVARYYQVAGKYPRSSDTLLREAQAFLRQRGQAYAGSGYITFRFIVDCQGHREPRTQVLQTDATYRRFAFPPALVSALYAYLQTLTEWRVGQAAHPVRYITYLNFKMQDGKVVAVTP
ncbi:hypothetical protein A0257_01815 [Hymenobacter psoromatis]|nr:hypothetical protein A0257_01815 [Hymenobacter psoromatis]